MASARAEPFAYEEFLPAGQILRETNLNTSPALRARMFHRAGPQSTAAGSFIISTMDRSAPYATPRKMPLDDVSHQTILKESGKWRARVVFLLLLSLFHTGSRRLSRALHQTRYRRKSFIPPWQSAWFFPLSRRILDRDSENEILRGNLKRVRLRKEPRRLRWIQKRAGKSFRENTTITTTTMTTTNPSVRKKSDVAVWIALLWASILNFFTESVLHRVSAFLRIPENSPERLNFT